MRLFIAHPMSFRERYSPSIAIAPQATLVRQSGAVHVREWPTLNRSNNRNINGS
ncbi:hypothetical protein BRPE64_ECDS00210 (plasmid) [Caballeronia insecticola]|uniref:Uncharacterized protein n=1 Tax=Caballeronia insecticola TaxID=758793 RepID=R4WUE6_9BURK|nr:hypothetical protein BRPE64_ECDS00210 [Caballeronia insecticola]